MKGDTANAIKQAEPNGEFKGVEYKSADGKYLLCAVTSDDRLSTLKEVGEFKKPVVKIEKMPKEELQKLVDKIHEEGTWYKPRNGHEQIAEGSISIKLKNSTKYTELIKVGKTEIDFDSFNRLRNHINAKKIRDYKDVTVEVTEVKYNSSNKINHVVIELK